MPACPMADMMMLLGGMSHQSSELLCQWSKSSLPCLEIYLVKLDSLVFQVDQCSVESWEGRGKRPREGRDVRQISNRCRSVCIGCGVEWFGLAWIGLSVVAWG